MKRLKFSVVLSATGNLHDSRYWPCDSELQHYVDVCDEYFGPQDPSEPGDSDYKYLATENGADGLKGAFIEGMGSFRDNTAAAQWGMIRWEGDSNVWWSCCSDYQNSGILTAREFFRFLRDCDVVFEDCDTLGTLGGPLGGIVPDVSFRSESQAAIVSMRATPFLADADDDAAPVTESSWERLKPFYADPWKCQGGWTQRVVREEGGAE